MKRIGNVSARFSCKATNRAHFGQVEKIYSSISRGFPVLGFSLILTCFAWKYGIAPHSIVMSHSVLASCLLSPGPDAVSPQLCGAAHTNTGPQMYELRHCNVNVFKMIVLSCYESVRFPDQFVTGKTTAHFSWIASSQWVCLHIH